MTNMTTKIGDAISYATITSKIKAKLVADSMVSALNISVETNNGNVTLTGKVPSQEAADRAVTIANDTDGVEEVTNKLKVQQ